jgi:cell division protein FtsB
MNRVQLATYIKSPLILVGLAALFIGLATIQYRQFKQRAGINKEIESLQQQQVQLEQKNQQLSDSLQYLSTSDYKDRVARQELGLKRNGELVYNFTSQGAPGQSGQEGATQASGPNFERWWLYLFKGSN